MMHKEYYRQDAVDLLTLILCLPFCLWLGWYGLMPAFGIGIALNIYCEKKESKRGQP